MSAETNDQLVLISGQSATGKSASLANIRNQHNWMLLNTEAGKRPPFANKFQSYRISDPYQVLEGFDFATTEPTSEGIILDSVTFLMDMFETMYVIGSANTMKGWSDYNQYFKILMQQKVINYGKPVIITAHTKDVYDEKALEYKTAVPIKGALAGVGVESFFSTVVATKRVSVKDLEPFKNDMLTITEEEEDVGFKYVFQTRLTPKTLGERIRSPMGLFDKAHTFINNDAQALLDKLKVFYA
jgi:hypothetical protein